MSEQVPFQSQQPEGTAVPPVGVASREDERSPLEMIGAGAVLAVLAGGAAGILAILGLVRQGSMPVYLMEVATIVLGIGLLVQGLAGGAHFTTAKEHGRLGKISLGGGVAAATIGGLAGLCLGIAALVGAVPRILCAIALIVYGVTVLLGAGTMVGVNEIAIEHGRIDPQARASSRGLMLGGAGLHLLAGIAAIVLGVLALFNLVPITLVLVGLLVVSVGILLGGLAISCKTVMFS